MTAGHVPWGMVMVRAAPPSSDQLHRFGLRLSSRVAKTTALMTTSLPAENVAVSRALGKPLLVRSSESVSQKE